MNENIGLVKIICKLLHGSGQKDPRQDDGVAESNPSPLGEDKCPRLCKDASLMLETVVQLLELVQIGRCAQSVPEGCYLLVGARH